MNGYDFGFLNVPKPVAARKNSYFGSVHLYRGNFSPADRKTIFTYLRN
ncbi:MAG: hypothetical protein P1U85_10110 [Verrucomicrobiales bacterium]|nr:hypothetical protein [Verrucomicrobiales bacterium]